MKKVFFDSWGWVAIINKADAYHGEVFSFYKTFLSQSGKPVTTDYILSETITFLRAKISCESVSVFIETILASVKEERMTLERIDEKRWTRAWETAKKYNDKPYISFVDFTSFIVMKELGVSNALTSDKHFEEVGMGFKKLF